jgi:hypothetical protein
MVKLLGRRMCCHANDRVMQWRAKVALIASLSCCSSAAWARDQTSGDFHVALTYVVQGSPRLCWNEADFRHSIEQRLGYDPFRPGPGVSVIVRVAGTTDFVAGQIDWRDAGGVNIGERQLVARDGDCRKLLTDVSFAVGLQIELLHPSPPASRPPTTESIGGAGSSTPSPPRPATSPSHPPRDEDTSDRAAQASAGVVARRPRPDQPDGANRQSAPETGSPWPWSWSAGAGPAVAWGIAPSPTAVGRLFVVVRRGRLALEIAGEASYPTTARQADRSAFRQRLLGAGLALCGQRNALSACVVGRVSQTRITGLDIDLPHSPDGLVVQSGGRLGAALPLGGPWSAAVYGELLGLLTPYRVILNQVAVWDMPRVAILAGVVLEARFR